MKTIKSSTATIITILLVIWIITGCEKKTTETCSDGIKNQTEVDVDCGGSCKPCAIKYPSSGTFGMNLLSGDDTLRLTGTSYSFMAIVPSGSTLKVELNFISGAEWWATSISSNSGWSISSYINGQQTFNVLNPGTCDDNIIKAPLYSSGSGVYLIKYFENSTTETKRKIIIWV